jgi:hypothetical protein
VVGCEASWARATPLHFHGTRVESVRSSAWMTRRLNPWLTGRGEWSYLHQSEGNEGDESATRRVRFDAALTALWR